MKRKRDTLVLDPALRTPESRLQASQERSSTNGSTSFTAVQQQRESPVLPLPKDNIVNDYDIAVERAQTWTMTARFGFNAMLASPDYKNKLRLRPDKLERIIHFLAVPDAKSREKDRADAQAKHQAQNWLFQGGVLYRKESRLQHPRRHVGADEVFDVLTAEHLRSGHHGRDKMLKVLEAKYIGYTKDELMYVLDRCLICSSKQMRGAAARRKELKQGDDPDHTI